MPDSVIILGTPVHALTRDAVVARCTEFLDTNRVPTSSDEGGRVGGKRLHQIVTANPEFLLAARCDQAVRQVTEQGSLIVPDGTGLLWAARHYGSRLPERVPGVDLLVDLCRMAARRSVPAFFLGGRGVVEAAAVSIRSLVPGLQVTAFLMDHEAAAPPRELWRELARVRPALLFVAYGAPRQEQWIHRHRGRLEALGVRIAMGVGGAFDILAGKFPRAPRWTRAAGLEWLWRLFLQPWRVSRIFRAVVLFPLAVLRDQR